MKAVPVDAAKALPYSTPPFFTTFDIMFDFSQNYFALFGLPEQFDIDSAKLAEEFRQLQGKYHPDRFVNSDEKKKRLAIQYTGYINEANETLKSPRLRARYLLTLRGVDFDDEVDTTSDGAFLLHQMELRESLEAAREAGDPLDAVDKIGLQVRQEMNNLEEEFKQSLDRNDLKEAKEAVLKMKFFERLAQEVTSLEEKLEDELF